MVQASQKVTRWSNTAGERRQIDLPVPICTNKLTKLHVSFVIHEAIMIATKATLSTLIFITPFREVCFKALLTKFNRTCVKRFSSVLTKCDFFPLS